LNLSYFISKRLQQRRADNFSSIIYKIAVGSIAIGLAAAIVSFLIMQGFQTAVKKKIYDFSNHLLITKFTMNNAVEEQPFDFKIDVYEHPKKFPFIENIQAYSHKAGLIKTEKDILGIVFKGIGNNYGETQDFASRQNLTGETQNFASQQKNIIEGRFIHFSDSGYSKEVVISKVISNKVDAKVGDDIILHFFQNPPRFRKLKVVGIYETNLSDYFDGKVLLGDIKMVQQLNGWKPNEAGGLEVKIDMNHFSGFQLWREAWSFHIQDIEESIINNPEYKGNRLWGSIGALFDFKYDHDKAALETSRQLIGDSMDYDLNIESVRDKYIQVFEWLDLVKRQVKILLVIILVVVSVNMISVILISVMERIPMVGILKAMGAGNSTIRSVFIHNGIGLITQGLFWGNAIGLGVCFLQYQFKIIKLNAHDYYVSYVPIEWSITTIIGLNVLVFATVTIVLFLPTRFITKISPVEAIRFD
jgi:lipoprotein-releasing system permease protein